LTVGRPQQSFAGVANLASGTPDPNGELLDELDIAAFEALTQRDMVIEHKCIEGWSSIVHWGGARFSDLHDRYAERVGDVVREVRAVVNPSGRARRPAIRR
jgi:hypothetical protein